MDVFCRAFTKRETQCRNKAGPDGYCHIHKATKIGGATSLLSLSFRKTKYKSGKLYTPDPLTLKMTLDQNFSKKKVVTLSYGYYHGGVVTKNDVNTFGVDTSLYMFGSGLLGTGDRIDRSTPIQILPKEKIIKISCGTFDTGVVTKDGKNVNAFGA